MLSLDDVVEDVSGEVELDTIVRSIDHVVEIFRLLLKLFKNTVCRLLSQKIFTCSHLKPFCASFSYSFFYLKGILDPIDSFHF